MKTPWIARALVKLAAPPAERDELLADLEDEARERARDRGPADARRWFWRQALGSIAPLVRRRAALARQARRLPEPTRRPLAGLRHDARDAIRALTHARGFTLIVVATLACGIGVNTAIFTVVDALLFKTLPYADGDRLVRVAEWPRTGGNFTVAPAAFLDWRARTRTLSLEARIGETTGLAGANGVEEVRGARVTAGYFDLLGVRAAYGRTFAQGDDRPGQPCRAVISHRLWTTRLGGRADAIGRPVGFADGACTIVGVLPPDSVFDRASFEVYRPAVFSAAAAQQNGRVLTVLGRLAPGVTLDGARTEIVALAARFNATRGRAGQGWTAALTPLRDVVVRSDTRQLAWVLFAAVALILMVACVNVASLSLTRAIDRGREFALRRALGAGRWRLFRALVIESLILASAGAALGLGVGSAALRLFVWLVPPGTLPPEAAAALDGRALLFTGGLAIATAIVCGSVAAWHGSTETTAGLLSSSALRAGRSRGAARSHNVLLIVEIAMAMILVSTATVLVVSFGRLTRVQPGFEPARVVTMPVTLPPDRYRTGDEVSAFYERALDAVRRLPGIARASAVTSLPLGGWLFGTVFTLEGVPSDPARPTSGHIQTVATDYFETLGIPMAAGRTFAPVDDARGPLVAIVNATLARRFLGAEPAVGRRITLGIDTVGAAAGPSREIVGVSRDVKTGGLGDADLATPEIYVPHTQSPAWSLVFTIRLADDTAHSPAGIRDALRAIDPRLPLPSMLSMDERVGASVRTQRFRTMMMAAFAGLAGVLACLGVYAVRSGAVRARLREIGIRVALGATRGQVLTLLVGHAMWPVGLGLIAGTAGTLLSVRVITPWLFATRADDPVLLTAATIALGTAALVASWVPARRAAAVDPLITLRHE